MNEFALAVRLRIKQDCVEQFMAEAYANAKSARETEPGCKQFDVLVEPGDPTSVLFYEVYADEAAFQAHQATAHLQRYRERALGFVESRERTLFTRRAP